MLTHSDIKYRQVVLLSPDELHHLCISQGNIVIKNAENAILTKLSRQQVLAIIIVGNCTLTSVLIDHCQKNSIALIVLNYRLRPILFASHFSEGNYLVRKRQYSISSDDELWFARQFVNSKLAGHIVLLKSIRKKDDELKQAIATLSQYQLQSLEISSLDGLMGIEGNGAKLFFKYHFAHLKNTTWQGRKPRLKLDPVNVVLDMGYTLLFNYVECNLRLFGFDVYKGMLHQLWFKRKSLVCDLVEPFRCIIDKQVLNSFNLGQFKLDHFSQIKHQYQLDSKHCSEYNAILMQAIIRHKNEIYHYVREFYRIFMKYPNMQDKPFPVFDLSAQDDYGEDL